MPNAPPATAVSTDDLLRIMQGMMAAQAQQFVQILQQAVQLPVQPVLAPAPVPVPPPSTNKKIRPTLPKYDGKTDADDHMDQFVALANAEHWMNEDRKQNFYKTLVKTASTWYAQNATEIETGIWEEEKTLFLDYFRSPTFLADRQVQALTRTSRKTRLCVNMPTRRSVSGNV